MIWVGEAVVLAAHDSQIAEHGGAPGIRDHGALQSELARPRNLQSYSEPDIAELAAAYAFGLARNHPFVDGNKRVSLVTTLTFLALNGYKIVADEGARVEAWMKLAEGGTTEAEFAAWLRESMARL